MIRLVSLSVCLLLAACSSNPEDRSWITYRIDVRQGNLVTQEMVAKLKPGQSKDQVRFILGTPLLADMFHADRWDYVYRFQPGMIGSESERRHLIVYFEKGKLSRVDGDVSAAQAGDIQANPPARVIDIPPAGPAAN